MAGKSLFERDFKKAVYIFPKLSYRSLAKGWVISGYIDICDNAGDYWGTFGVSIEVPHSYPYCIPAVKETTGIIRRDSDRHVSTDGNCCLDVEHNLIVMSKKGIDISSFIDEMVYPFFANQIYYREKGRYAGKEYRHGFSGIVQFYEEKLNIVKVEKAILVIRSILNHNIPGRNDDCFCGKDKFKRCRHSNAVEFLQMVGEEQLKEDLAGFEKILKTSQSLENTV